MNSASRLQFKIAQLRQEKISQTIEGIGVLVLSALVFLYVPSIISYFFFRSRAQTPQFISEYLPVAAIVFAVTYFVFVLVANMMRSRQIRQLENELAQAASFGDDCCGGDCHCGDGHMHDHMEMTTKVEPITPVKSASTSALAAKMKSSNQKKKAKGKK